GCRSEPADVLRLRALAALRDVELHPLVLLQAAEAGGRDGREVGEHVSAAVVGRDETEALVCVEPFHRTGGHVLSFSFTGLVRSPQNTQCAWVTATGAQESFWEPQLLRPRT